jgi:hypothetical protein
MEPNKAVTIKGIPESLWKRVRMKALSVGDSVSEFVTKALKAALEKESK